MKKFFILSLLFILSLISCTVQDDRTGGNGNPDCPYCHGDGYIKKTDLFVFYTYYDRGCKYRDSYYYDGNGEDYNPSFKGSEASKYNGKKCGVWKGTQWCDCYGCSSSNRDPFICSRCGHRCNKHTR